jgi:4'-phosphopantetheinyl transferase
MPAMTTRSAARSAMIPESRTPDTRDASVADLVHVWLVPTDQPPTVLAQLAPLLDDEERRRAASHHSTVQRARFVAAHGATRRIVAAQLGVDPGQFAWRRGEHGKPEPDVDGVSARISVSTCAEVAFVAVGTSPTPSLPLREVGIDVERLISDHEATRLAARFFPPDQAEYVAEAREHGGAAERFATLWCRKEACVKALGGRLVQGLGLSVQGDAPLVADFSSSPDAEYRVCDVPAPRNFRAAVALKGAAPYQLRCRIWSPFH